MAESVSIRKIVIESGGMAALAKWLKKAEIGNGENAKEKRKEAAVNMAAGGGVMTSAALSAALMA
jgi:hypothetical protein